MVIEIEFSERGIKDFSNFSMERKTRIVRALERARENPETALDPISEHPYHTITVDNSHVLVVEWDKDNNTISVLSGSALRT